MPENLLTPVLSQPGVPQLPPETDDPTRIRDAAQQFEALLLAQLLSSARESGGGGWFGLGADPASDSATGFAEQQLAMTLAQQGGIGLSTLITRGLSK